MSLRKSGTKPPLTAVLGLAMGIGLAELAVAGALPIDERPVQTPRDAEYPGGLIVTLPVKTHQVRLTGSGFQVLPERAEELRNPWTVDVRFQAGALPDSASMSTRSIDGREVRYRIESDSEAGSGGALHTLTAEVACGGGHIAFIATQQAEYPDEPDFAPAWEVIARTRCKIPPAGP